MGYDVERFVVEEMEDELLCLVCTSVLQDPVETPCEHFFCKICVSQWLTQNASCPVDRKPLRILDLKQPSRLLRNLLAKLEIKCEFQEQGCDKVVKLEHLPNHLLTCNYRPNAQIICKKGCNLQIIRRDLASSCFVHFENKIRCQEVEILQLSGKLNDQSAKITKLKETVIQQQTELERLGNVVAVDPFSRIRFFLQGETVWQTFVNIKTNYDQRVLETDDKSKDGVAQLAHHLEPTYPYFSLCVLNNGPLIGMGLTSRYWGGPWHNGRAVVYRSNGTVHLNGEIVYYGEEWKESDLIGCGIRFPANRPTEESVNGSPMNLQVSFYKNFEEIKIVFPASLSVLYPTIWINGKSNR
ncbi:hypothetical protein HA402_009660 [Bradysia odoriphaga]|nr:hypothetical protein HA402_009660 [Bradysia odoriphaga]